MPISHTVEHLDTALRIARHLRCPLLALCSQKAAATATRSLVTEKGTELVAIDFADVPGDVLLPRLRTTELLAETPFAYHRDTSAKRNLGLLLANLMGWRRIVFLDDDIKVPNPDDLGRAAYLLDRYAAVGLAIDTYPDHSVVCHAHRVTGGALEPFIGGGALAVGGTATASFFPTIYNEDWFFLLDGYRLYPAAVGGVATQEPYNPYDDIQRAESEEFGDCLAEGVFALLHEHRTIRPAACRQYWRRFLDRRRAFIADVIGRVTASGRPADEKPPMIAALTAAAGRCALIEPSTCVDYLRAWRIDRLVWRRHVETLQREHRPGLSRLGQPARLEKVLSGLGLMECSCLTMT